MYIGCLDMPDAAIIHSDGLDQHQKEVLFNAISKLVSGEEKVVHVEAKLEANLVFLYKAKNDQRAPLSFRDIQPVDSETSDRNAGSPRRSDQDEPPSDGDSAS